MLHNCEEDSGRSSCSASGGLSPIIDKMNFDSSPIDLSKLKHMKRHSKDFSSNTDLKVSNRPRSFVSLLKSPDEKDPFPSYRLPRHHRQPVLNLFNMSRRGGLSTAHSTLDIASSTQIETAEPRLQNNTLSMNAILKNDFVHKNTCKTMNFRRGKPVQRAASRLYKADSDAKGKEGCTGPEFIVRASQSPRKLDLTLSANSDRKIINVVLLNGQQFEVTCDSNIITAGQLFEALIHSEKYEHNFMLGIAALIGGDFVFLPDDYKLKKLAPEGWHKANCKKNKILVEDDSMTVFLRIKFFLPKNISNNIQDGEWQYRVYLQLRRATVEGQLTSTIQNLVLLAGYALHVEFGEFSYREHGSADYFLLEHYLPETVITNNMADIKLRMKRAHESRHGLDRNKAIINFITLAQTFRDYGAHFYSAVWSTRDGFCRDVWLSIGPRGITIYSRYNQMSIESCSTNRIVLQCLPWHHIRTFYYNKKSLYIIPNSYSGLSKIGIKYKLKMTDNKSYFSFWLASLHHRLYLKLYAKEDFINYLADELNCAINQEGSPKKVECSNYQDSYNLAVRNPIRSKRPMRRRFKMDIFGDKNKENEKPNTEELLRQVLSPLHSEENLLNTSTMDLHRENSSNECLSSSESCSLPKRHGVKMGTRVFNGMKPFNKYGQTSPPNNYTNHHRSDEIVTTQSDSDDFSLDRKQCTINSMRLLPERHYNTSLSNIPTAYVLESPKIYPENHCYIASNDSCLNTSLFERLDNMECVQGERLFVTAVLQRDQMNALGLQVAEGSDGNVYIKSITSGSPADACKKLLPGDQIISVNGKTLLNIKYDKALELLQSAPQTVELIVLQNSQKYSHISTTEADTSDTDICKISGSIGSALDTEITDDELLNEEALKTIYALIKFTKEKVINRIKEKPTRQNSPNERSLYKSSSENKVYEENDLGTCSSQEDTPQKKNKFDTWRSCVSDSRPRRRPLSLSIPKEINFDRYLDENNKIKKSSLVCLQSGPSGPSDDDSNSVKNVALPRNFGLSRKWVGPVRYPVTPCKNVAPEAGAASRSDGDVTRRHFVYGIGDSDEDQIFL